MADQRDLFNIIVDRSEALHRKSGRPTHQTFVEWFMNMYFVNPSDVYYSDGANDGKVDAILKESSDKAVTFHIFNSKFTKEYNKKAPPPFYAEIQQFYEIFRNKDARGKLLTGAVKSEVAKRLSTVFDAYDDGRTQLYFITNHKVNEAYYSQVQELGIHVYHLEDLVQFLIDDLDGAMPKTDSMVLTEINSVLTPSISDTEVSTSIVFGKLKDFIDYMKEDTHDLLFARNIRLDLGNSGPNIAIRNTFKTAPHEFAYSNNGITMICDRYSHEPGSRELIIYNPRVVNGSQTLHSIRKVTNPSGSARVMIRIIRVPPASPDESPKELRKKKEIVNKISTRTNQQNPVKPWNLVANDDFQLELFRFFRSKNLFYERRDKEWKSRSRELRSRDFRKGPNIKLLMQLITSSLWGTPKMGPFVARTLGDVFESIIYDELIKIEPEEAYRLYLLAEITSYIYSNLRRKNGSPKYFNELKGYIDLVLFGTIVDLFRSAASNRKNYELTAIIEQEQGNKYRNERLWEQLIGRIIKHVYSQYQKMGKIYKRKEGKTLSIANYFKTPGNSDALLSTIPPKNTLNLVKAILRSDS